MDQGLKYIFREYKLFYNATKEKFINAKKEFAEFKALPNPTKEQIKDIINTKDSLFQVNYMMMDAWISVFNLKANYPEDMQAEIDGYELMSKRASWLIGAINDYVKSLSKTNDSSVEL